ncbi:hypothetical protein ACFQDG_06105 [Natronoarchaeum mannanilyticum]|uniref:PGF-CTERM sorting domain-containing protein n=1 Tax=Natronoarchaeum mannanilyticum TaxID=926360 RepID=A0AAV3TE63_9EURY
MKFFKGAYRHIAAPDNDVPEPVDDAPPTSLRTKLAMAAVTFLSAVVATMTLQRYRRRKRTKDV